VPENHQICARTQLGRVRSEVRLLGRENGVAMPAWKAKSARCGKIGKISKICLFPLLSQLDNLLTRFLPDLAGGIVR
jgi:hypothetical protein